MVFFILVILNFMYRLLVCCGQWSIAILASLFFFSSPALAETIELDIEGMTCGACADGLKKILENVESVSDVSVNHETKKAKFTVDDDDPLHNQQIRKVVEKAGLKATKIHRPNADPRLVD